MQGTRRCCLGPHALQLRSGLCWQPTPDLDVLQRYDHDLDAAFEAARERGDLTPLVQTVRRWWFEADAWRDAEAQREFLARIERYQREGPPPSRSASSQPSITSA